MEKAAKLFNTTKQLNAHPEILTLVANFYWRFGEYPEGRLFARKAQRLAQRISNLYEEALALRVESGCNIFLGDYTSTVFLLNRAKELMELCGSSESILYYRVLDLEAEIHLRKSQYAEARKIYVQIAAKLSAQENPVDHAYALLPMGEIDIAIGAYDATKNLEKARELFTSLNFHYGAFTCDAVLVEHQLKTEGVETAPLKATLEKILAFSWSDDALVTFAALERMGDPARWPLADFNWASTYSVVYLAFSTKKKDKLAVHKALRCLGDVFLTNGEEQTAEHIFLAALDGFTNMDVHRSRAECLIRLGDLAKNRR
ncbi:hypothetical protein C8R45DRAFT_965529, partial [Mycena sanguinolenta]